jgi:hypothetical protein
MWPLNGLWEAEFLPDATSRHRFNISAFAVRSALHHSLR